jgi:hypothetical protein
MEWLIALFTLILWHFVAYCEILKHVVSQTCKVWWTFTGVLDNVYLMWFHHNLSFVWSLEFSFHSFVIAYSVMLCVVLCFVDRASLYNLANKANLVHSLLLVYLSICTFQANLCPSSGETAVFMQPLVLVILCGWLSSTQNNKYQGS